MEEGNNLSNCQLFFCKAEDLETGKEEWTEVKHVDNICLRDKTTIPELEVKEPWPTSWSFTATVKNPDVIAKFNQKPREYQSRRFHYIQQIMPRETKDYFRKFSLALKVKKLKKKYYENNQRRKTACHRMANGMLTMRMHLYVRR